MENLNSSQEVFDKVVSHLRAQNAKSTINSGVGCAYRGENCRKCAIGCLIPDEEYNPKMEGKPLWDLLRLDHQSSLGLFPENSKTNEMLREHFSMLDNMQWVHDMEPIRNWENEFKKVAKLHSLIYTPPSA